MFDTSKLASFWKFKEELYDEDTLNVFFGECRGDDTIGICWDDYPKSRGETLTPICLDKKLSNIILNGLLMDALHENNSEQIEKIIKIKEKLQK